MISFFSLSGYTKNDPLDKPNGVQRFLIPIAVNLLLTAVLLPVITNTHIVQFNGFSFLGFHFSENATRFLEFMINGFVFTPLIVLFRKASSVIHFFIVLLPYYILDLFIDSHYRDGVHDYLALWIYPEGSIVSGIHVHALKYFVTVSADAILFGIIGLYLARLIASGVYHKLPAPIRPNKSQYNELFRKEWSEENISRPKRGLAFWLLRLLGLSYLLYLLILVLGLCGSKPWPSQVANLIDMTYKNPALAINTYFKITLMAMLTFLGAYNINLRYFASVTLLFAHLVSTGYLLSLYFISSLGGTDRDFLLTSGIVDGGMVVIFLIIAVSSSKHRHEFDKEHDLPINFSVPMTLMKNLFRAIGITYITIAVAIIVLRLFADPDKGVGAIFGYPDPMIGNTLTLFSTLAFIALLQVNRDRIRKHLFNCLVFPLVASSIVALLWLAIGDTIGEVLFNTRGNKWIAIDSYFVAVPLFNMSIAILLIITRKMYYKVDYTINTLSPSAAINAMALSTAWYDNTAKENAAVLRSIDQFVGGIRGRRRGLLNLPFGLFENVFNILFGLHPPFSAMSRAEQRYFLMKYIFRNQIQRDKAFNPPLAEVAYQIGLSLNALVSFAQYSETNTRFKIGYVPLDARDRLQADFAKYPPPFKSIFPLPKDHQDPNNFKPETSPESEGKLVAPRVTTIINEPDIPDEADYVIVGSGAGGAVTAYRLACEVKDPYKIIIIERGHRYQPLQDFQDNEIEMMKKIYKEGGLQQTNKFTMTVLQGECVGGSTITNNAVCFKIPSAVKSKWEDHFGLDLSGLEDEYNRIKTELNIAPLGDSGINRVVKNKFENAVAAFNGRLPLGEKLITRYPVEVNFLNNIGDGNWNLGNKRMRKRSMLETYIPWSEARGVKVIPRLTAVRFIAQRGRAKEIVVRSDNGELKRIKVNKAIIVSGGAIASSNFLMRSDVDNPNIGKQMSCNFAFPIAFDFDEEIKAFDGEQITLGALDPQSRAAFETYYNPPAAFALSCVPFIFEERNKMMARYANMLNFGCLIGSEPNGIINKKPNILNGQAFSWQLGTSDIDNIKYSFNSLLKLGHLAGGKTAFLPTKPGIKLILNNANLESFEKALRQYPLRFEDLFIGTAHPQGGNLMAAENSPAANERVVDQDYRVKGYENVFVADASPFPTSITINPQWTIMAIASLASRSILKLAP